jgi:hypothetical protein
MRMMKMILQRLRRTSRVSWDLWVENNPVRRCKNSRSLSTDMFEFGEKLIDGFLEN